jgi:hypothetical protein
MTEGHPPPAAISLPPRDAQDDLETIAFFARYQEVRKLEAQLGKLESQKDKLIEVSFILCLTICTKLRHARMKGADACGTISFP